MKTLQKLKTYDLSPLGFDQNGEKAVYFCTPKGSTILASAGVDGIHYVTIRGCGPMVFAVCPMNLPGQFVHPIARSGEELVRLLLAAGSMQEHI